MRYKFGYYDADGDGLLSPLEFQEMLKDDGEEYSDDEIEDIIRKLDGDHDGQINFEKIFMLFKWVQE